MNQRKKRTSGTSRQRSRDPHHEREASRYAHPVSSREFILDTLTEQGVPVTEEELGRLLKIPPQDRDAFAKRLSAMQRDGEIMRNRRDAICVVAKLDLVRGRVQGHADGFGFLVRDEGGPDLFLGPKEMRGVMHGDRAMARISGTDRRGRPEGQIVEVLERGHQRLVGRLRSEHGILFVAAEDKRISHEFLVPPDAAGGAKPGQVVTVEIVAQPSRHAQPVARVVEVLGNYADPGMEIEIALRKHTLPHAFSQAVEHLCAGIPDTVTAEDQAGRTDLTQLPLVTIDGETAKDFDDAVYCEPLLLSPPYQGGDGKRGVSPPSQGGEDRGGWRLIVAIADVSHYVKHGDALDREAASRGNSVYFPRRVIPMLPEKLSNGLCSLNPKVPRLAVVCDMRVGADGDIASYRFYPAVFRSHARLTYTEVAAMLGDENGEAGRRYRALLPHIQNLHRLYKVLVKARERRGAIDFETIETEMIFDAHGKIERIVPVKRNDAHRVIEECMLAANVCASDFLHGHDHPMLYRIHEGPTPEKLTALREFLKGFGLQLSGGDDPHARDYAKLLAKVRDRPDAQLIQTVMLRSLKQAVYSPDNLGHFGLAYESYTHFTSPIRRYPDLLVHRAIKAVLKRKHYDPGNWHELGAHCSMTERRADEATRDVVSWLKCYYMKDRVGDVFEGSVSGVTAFGAFVALDGVYVEGLLHVSELGSDYFHYDAGKHHLMGERTRKRYRLGDRVRVKVVRVDLDTSRIDFVLG
ncbi:MAG TPA: ribonuclease R [Burkholderiales bacterium]|nr:ribonuclease R [Burkholderiales bacterium]